MKSKKASAIKSLMLAMLAMFVFTGFSSALTVDVQAATTAKTPSVSTAMSVTRKVYPLKKAVKKKDAKTVKTTTKSKTYNKDGYQVTEKTTKTTTTTTQYKGKKKIVIKEVEVGTTTRQAPLPAA